MKTKKFEIEIDEETIQKYKKWLYKGMNDDAELIKEVFEKLLNIKLSSVKEIKPQEPTMWQIRDIDSGEILYDDISLEKALEIGEGLDKNKVVYVPKPNGNWIL